MLPDGTVRGACRQCWWAFEYSVRVYPMAYLDDPTGYDPGIMYIEPTEVDVFVMENDDAYQR